MTNEQKLAELVKELNEGARYEMYTKKDYDYLSKGWLKMEYSDDPKLNECEYDVTDATIPFFDNTLIDLIRLCEQRYHEYAFVLNGDFNGIRHSKKLGNEARLWVRRFDFFRYCLNIHNHDAYLKYID